MPNFRITGPVMSGVPADSYFEKIWLTGSDNVEKAALTFNNSTKQYNASGDWSWPVGGQFRIWVRTHAVNTSGNNWQIAATALLLSPAAYVDSMSRWNAVQSTNNPAIINMDLNSKRDQSMDNVIDVPDVPVGTVFTYRIKLWSNDQFGIGGSPEIDKW